MEDSNSGLAGSLRSLRYSMGATRAHGATRYLACLLMEVLCESQVGFEPGFSNESKGPAWSTHMRHSLAEGAACLALQWDRYQLWDHTKQGHWFPNLFGTSLCSNPMKHQALYTFSCQGWPRADIGGKGASCTDLLLPSSLCRGKQHQHHPYVPRRSNTLKKICCNRNKLLMSCALHGNTQGN